MREGDIVRITGKVSNKIKEVPLGLVGTYIGYSNTKDSPVVEVLMADGTIHRVKQKDIEIISHE